MGAKLPVREVSMAATKKTKEPDAGVAKGTKRVKRAVKRTLKKNRPGPKGASRRTKSVKPTAEHPLPEPIATFTF
jgi:hypothetical protein